MSILNDSQIRVGAEGDSFPYDYENGAHEGLAPLELGEDIDASGNIVAAVILTANGARDWVTTESAESQIATVNKGETLVLLEEHRDHVLSVVERGKRRGFASFLGR